MNAKSQSESIRLPNCTLMFGSLLQDMANSEQIANARCVPNFFNLNFLHPVAVNEFSWSLFELLGARPSF